MRLPKVELASLANFSLRLRFPDQIEKQFQQDYAQESLIAMRISMVLALALYSAFAILDGFATPQHRNETWLIRFVIVDPVFAITLLATFRPFFVRVSQVWMALVAMITGLGIIVIIGLVGRDEVGFWLYYAGLILVIFWLYTLARLRFLYATLSSLVIVVGYEIVAILGQHLLDQPEGVTFFINNNFFLLSAMVIGMVTGYMLELYGRRDFLQRYALAQQNIDLEAYARTVAHDLKNPLGIITGQAEIIDEEYGEQLPGDARQLLSIISSTSQNMTRIINELLLLARIRKTEDLELTQIEMEGVVNSALDRLARVIHDSGAKIVRPENWPAALGHAPWLEEVWANYISNAIKYGGEPPVIELGASVENNWARFWVRDNGQGLTPEQETHLFAEFTRLENVGLKEGHGLGLSIVQRILEKLGGRVGVESTLGQGSLFYFVLPVASDAVKSV